VSTEAPLNLQNALKRSVAGAGLSSQESYEVFSAAIGDGADPLQLAALLASLATRGEAVAEIAGAARALREAMLPFGHPFPQAIDTCGTGGDGLGSFNLSSAAAIVAAAAGAVVIKHGNRAQSSRCGSADLLEAAGLPLELSGEAAREVLERCGITFLYAPAWHPALRRAAAVRRALGVRTIFNLLGPLANPGRVRRQLLGVGERRRAAAVAEVLAALGCERAYVVHGGGGADELTLEEGNLALPVGSAPPIEFDARALGLEPAPARALEGGDARANLGLLARVLEGERSPLADAVALNAGAALVVAEIASDAAEGLSRAREALESGAARDKLARWIEAARRAGGSP
jgi:anthranilate phosphoribosyltransferase